MLQALDGKKYLPNKTSEWTDTISNQIIEKLKRTAPYFKYVVTLCFIQKVGAGIHGETIAYWDQKTDGMIQTKYENDSLICLCTVLGIAI
jgi:hypothetical protein